MRVISLVPSITATLCHAGLESTIVGCTNFCVDPPHLHRTAALVGGTKNPDIKSIAALTPDIIFVNKEENRREDIPDLEAIAPLFISFAKTPHDVLGEFQRLHQLFQMAKFMDWHGVLKALLKSLPHTTKGRALYLIWKNPYMSISADTFIGSMLTLFGYELPSFSDSSRYPTLTDSEFASLDPDIVFLSTEPYPFRKRDLADIRKLVGNDTMLMKADGKLMSWHGVHTIQALEQFKIFCKGDRQHLFQSF